jgi:hypothetical protein
LLEVCFGERKDGELREETCFFLGRQKVRLIHEPWGSECCASNSVDWVRAVVTKAVWSRAHDE